MYNKSTYNSIGIWCAADAVKMAICYINHAAAMLENIDELNIVNEYYQVEASGIAEILKSASDDLTDIFNL